MLNLEIVDDMPFVVTKQVKDMAQACYCLLETRDMGVVYGEAGVGKTQTAERMVKSWEERGHPKAIYTEADVGASPARVAMKILRVMTQLRAANASDAARIIENLTRDQEVDIMILDEAERLSRQGLDGPVDLR